MAELFIDLSHKALNVIIVMGILLSMKVNGQSFEQKFEHVKSMSDSLNYDKAIRTLQKIISEAKALGEDSIISFAYIKAGSAYANLGKPEIALDYYHKARQIAKDHNLARNIALSNYGIASVFQEKAIIKNSLPYYDSSLKYYRSPLEYFVSQEESKTLSHIYSNISYLHTSFQENKLGKVYAELAIKMQIKILDNYGLGHSFYNLGELERRNNDFQKAIGYYKNAIKAYSTVSYSEGISKSIRSIAVCYYKSNIDDSSSFYFYKYDSIGHDIFHQDYQDKILELEIKFRTAEIERDNAIKQAEIENQRSQLTLMYVILSSLALLTLSGYLFFNQRRRRIQSEFERKEEQARQETEDLLQEQEIKTAYALLDGRDQERKRIASELHDSLGSILVTLNMYADSLSITSDPKKINELSYRISSTSKQANDEVRKISHSLDSGLLKHFGLKAAISQLMEAIQVSKNIQVHMILNIDDFFSNDVGLETYRIVQELVNNSLKHSQCSLINIEVNQIKKELNIIYEDNGIGFDYQAVSKGMGLNNIEKRAEKFGGDVKIDSGKNGSTFIIDIPLP